MDRLFSAPVSGTISNGRHRDIRFRACLHSGDVFFDDHDYDGLALTIEIADSSDFRAMLKAVSSIDKQITSNDLATTFMATRPDLSPASLDEWLIKHDAKLSVAERGAGQAILNLWQTAQQDL